MKSLFDRYGECARLVESMEDGAEKEHAKSVLSQLLHLEQGRRVAADAYKKYCREMDEWENNLVKNIKSIVSGKGL